MLFTGNTSKRRSASVPYLRTKGRRVLSPMGVEKLGSQGRRERIIIELYFVAWVIAAQ